jgi:hypothetical protein
MKCRTAFVCLLAICHTVTYAQQRREDIYTDFVLYGKRSLLEKDLRENMIARTFSLPLDSNTVWRYESACRAVTQFMLTGPQVIAGFDKLFAQYDSLEYETKKALLESVYGLYPNAYAAAVEKIVATATEPLLFAMAAAYVTRHDTSLMHTNDIRIRMVEQFPNYDSIPVLAELEKYLDRAAYTRSIKASDIIELFKYQQTTGKKIIYSFQRHNRDYPGLAIVQNANGQFVRHPDGRLMVFEQLARSASALPYFITNGNTPQGVYSITGIAVANNKLIGPTPNLQLILPYERKWSTYFQLPDSILWDSTQDALAVYQQLLPPSLRNHIPLTEAYYAGMIGRSAIIAHGTTIDPEYFKDKPWYPLTPTMGCLCAKELWNTTNGHLLVSEQFNLVSSFSATPGYKGYLYVIDVDDQQKPVSRAEVDGWVRKYEAGRKK